MSGWEGGIRTDAIIYASFLPQGVVKKDLFYIGDFLPTLLNLAQTNVKVSVPIDGIDQSNMLQFDKPPFRNEVVTIDDVNQYSSFIFQGTKLVNGTYAPFKGMIDSWIGSNNNSDINASKYIKGVLNSKVARAINSISSPLEPKNIRKLRQNAAIDCGNNVSNNCDLFKSPCIYDIVNDPCERVNLATSNPTLFNMMLQLFDDKLKTVVPSLRKPGDPAADPKYFNYTWNWWQ